MARENLNLKSARDESLLGSVTCIPVVCWPGPDYTHFTCVCTVNCTPPKVSVPSEYDGLVVIHSIPI